MKQIAFINRDWVLNN